MDDVLKDAFHRGTYTFRAFDRKHKLEMHCRNCGRSGHYKNKCDIPIQDVAEDPQETEAAEEVLEDEQELDGEDSDLDVNHPETQSQSESESDESSDEEQES